MKKITTSFQGLFMMLMALAVLSSCSSLDRLSVKWKYRNDFWVKTSKNQQPVKETSKSVAVENHVVFAETPAQTTLNEEEMLVAPSQSVVEAPTNITKATNGVNSAKSEKASVKEMVKQVKQQLKEQKASKSSDGATFANISIYSALLAILFAVIGGLAAVAFLGTLAYLLGAVAIISGIISLIAGEGRNGQAVLGIILGALAFLLFIIVAAIIVI